MNAMRWAAAVVVVLTICMNAGALWVLLATDFIKRFAQPGFTEVDVAIVDATIAAFAAVTVCYVATGFLLAGRPGAGRIAAVLLAGGFLFTAIPFGYGVGAQLVFYTPASELANAVFLLGPLAVGPGYVLILPGLALGFPTGRLPSRRWHLPVGLAAVVMIAATTVELFLPGPIESGTLGSHNPFGIEGLPIGLRTASEIAVAAAVLVFMALGVVAVLSRYRSGDATLRHQLRWFIAAVLLAALPLPLAITPGFAGPQWGLVASVGLILVPLSVGIAVTRYRLFEIDRLISRTIGWALVTGVLVAIFAATLLGLQAILSFVTQGETLAVAASTLVAFALFQPVRRRVQSAVDRRFDRARYDSESTADAFATVLRDEVDLSKVRSALLTAVDGAIQPVRVGVWLRKGL